MAQERAIGIPPGERHIIIGLVLWFRLGAYGTCYPQ